MKRLFTLAIIAMIATLTFAQAPIKVKMNPAQSELIKMKKTNALKSKMMGDKHQFKMTADKISHSIKLDKQRLQKVAASNKARAKAFAAEAADIQISVSDIASTKVTLNFVPGNNEAYYNIGVIEAEEFADYTEDEIIETAKEDLDWIIELYQMFGMETTYLDLIYNGELTGPYSSLAPDTEYVVYAYYIDPETGEATSGLATETFKTEAIQMSENVITYSYDKEKNVLNIETTNDDPYIFWMETMDDFEMYQGEVSDESVLAELEDWIYTFEQYDLIDQLTLSGNQEIDLNDFWLEWIADDDMETADYIAFAAPYDALVNGDVSYTQFHYDAPELVITDSKTLHVVNPEWSDYVADYGWWQIVGYTDDKAYAVSLSNNYTEEAVGTYEMEDMDGSYTFITDNETGKNIKFSNIYVVVAQDENGLICVNAEGDAKDGVHYIINFDPVDPTAVRGNQYDMPEGSISASFDTADIEEFEVDADEGYAYIRCAKGNESMSIFIYIDEELEAGTYEVNDTYMPGSVQACSIQGSSVYPSFYATLTDDGYLNVPLFFFNSGTVTVSYDEASELVLEAHVVNTWGAEGSFYVNCTPTAIKQVTAETAATKKQLINNQIVIMKNGKNYNVAGVEMK